MPCILKENQKKKTNGDIIVEGGIQFLEFVKFGTN